MVKDAYYFLIPLLILAGISLYLRLPGWGLLWLLLAAFVAFFFRDPERSIPQHPEAIVSPADGKIIRLAPGARGGVTVSIFLSLWDVHVNRAPLAGTVLKQEYRPGRFVAAFDDRASLENEQMLFTIGAERSLSFSLIAGILARRIVAWKKEGDRVNKGDRIALIRFGSRVDVFLPPGCELAVRKGDRVRGGSSILAYWRSGP